MDNDICDREPTTEQILGNVDLFAQRVVDEAIMAFSGDPRITPEMADKSRLYYHIGLVRMMQGSFSGIMRELPGQETIVAAAIKYGDLIGSVPAPGRHHDVIRAWADRARLVTRGKDEQGFTTSTGRFVGREEAMSIAVAAGQVDPRNRKSGSASGDLFSEDLW